MLLLFLDLHHHFLDLFKPIIDHLFAWWIGCKRRQPSFLLLVLSLKLILCLVFNLISEFLFERVKNHWLTFSILTLLSRWILGSLTLIWPYEVVFDVGEYDLNVFLGRFVIDGFEVLKGFIRSFLRVEWRLRFLWVLCYHMSLSHWFLGWILMLRDHSSDVLLNLLFWILAGIIWVRDFMRFWKVFAWFITQVWERVI